MFRITAIGFSGVHWDPVFAFSCRFRITGPPMTSYQISAFRIQNHRHSFVLSANQQQRRSHYSFVSRTTILNIHHDMHVRYVREDSVWPVALKKICCRIVLMNGFSLNDSSLRQSRCSKGFFHNFAQKSHSLFFFLFSRSNDNYISQILIMIWWIWWIWNKEY